MLQQQTSTQIKITDLLQEVKLLRSAVIGFIGKDKEG
jgi:hypothetical protein